jgi:hypothetical protein
MAKVMTAEEALEWGKTLDFRSVWAFLTQLGERVDETSRNIDRMSKENAANIDRLSQENTETRKNIESMMEGMKRMNKQIGGQGDTLGMLIETLFAARLWEKFPQYDLKRAYRRMPIYSDKSRQVGEVDILLSNTDWAMAVEVKAEPVEEDVPHHIRRMGLLQTYPLAEIKGKKLLGAFACGFVPDNVRDAAHKAGFFVLELNGYQVDLLPPPHDFAPGVW